MKTIRNWWRRGYIVRPYAGRRDETSVALVTIGRVCTFGVTVTELSGVHITFSLRLFIAEFSMGFALWDEAVQ